MKKIFCYIHIPFCELKCKYCRFVSVGYLQEKQIDFYVKNLISEIEKSPFKKEILSSVYFGGGTPSVLNKRQLLGILNTLENKYGFQDNIEISLESTPNNITKENLEIWNELGINRLSIGIQTLNKRSLKEINRGEKGDINNCLENLKKYSKLKNISLDFIIGLPHVELGEVLENIKYILNKYDFVKHISVYMLEEYYSPDKIIETKYDNVTYPQDWDKFGIDEKDYLGEYSSIKKYLENWGFHRYEISNYSKKGFECKHNIGYWNHKDVIAFGLGAYGYIDQTRYANSDTFNDYYLGKKILKTKLNKNDLFIEKVMFNLRTSGLEEKILKRLNNNKINYFIENGYLKKESDKIILTDSGVLVMDYILSEII